jgi:multidrug resistance efflux pump
MTPQEEFIIQMTTLLSGFIVTLLSLYIKHRGDMTERKSINDKVDHVATAVNGIPGEPTVKEQTAIIQETLRSEVIPRITDTGNAVHLAGAKADVAATSAQAAAVKADIAATKADVAATAVTAAVAAQKEGC